MVFQKFSPTHEDSKIDPKYPRTHLQSIWRENGNALGKSL